MKLKIYKTLYKRDSKGKLRVWYLVVEGDNKEVEIRITSGIYQTPSSIIKNSKQVLPSKVKNAYDRAIGLADGKHKRKIESGYCKTIEEANSWTPTRPALAKTLYLDDIEKTFKESDYPLLVDPKLNGVRAMWEKNASFLQSRYGKNFKRIAGIHHSLVDCPYALDGEIYSHGMMLQDIVHTIKTKDIPNDKDLLKYHVFDMPDRDGTSYKERKLKLLEWYEGQSDSLKEIIKIVSFKLADNPEDIRNYFIECVDLGYEGIMVKTLESEYQWDKRTPHTYKIKPVDDDEFRIVDVVSEEVSGVGSCIIFVCKTEEGKRFAVVPKWSKAQRQSAWYDNRNGNIGKLLSVEYRGESRDRIPLHPIGIAIRDYE